VEAVADGATALKVLEAGTVDLMLTDLRLPDMSGLELHKNIQLTKPAVATILMTAYGTAEARRQAEEQGVRFWLTKPLNIESLLNLVKEVVTKRTNHRSEIFTASAPPDVKNTFLMD